MRFILKVKIYFLAALFYIFIKLKNRITKINLKYFEFGLRSNSVKARILQL
jgi:hypothetical protein